MIKQIVRFAGVIVFVCASTYAFAADPPGLITVPSNNSVADTIQRFEDAVKASGWMVFTRLDHAAAAEKYQQKLLPRTVIVYGIRRWNGQHGEGADLGHRHSSQGIGLAGRSRKSMVELQFGPLSERDSLCPPWRTAKHRPRALGVTPNSSRIGQTKPLNSGSTAGKLADRSSRWLVLFRKSPTSGIGPNAKCRWAPRTSDAGCRPDIRRTSRNRRV